MSSSTLQFEPASDCCSLEGLSVPPNSSILAVTRELSAALRPGNGSS